MNTLQTPQASNQNWSTLSGYEAVYHQIQHSFRSNRLPPVVLLSGHRGIGKSIFLNQCAGIFICESNQSCSQCQSCLQIHKSQHTDLLQLNPIEGRYRAEQAEEVIQHLSHHPQSTQQNSFRVVTIPDVDLATSSFMNKLLKTFEEPPSRGIILLSTSREKDLLETILSRVLIWRVPNFSADLTTKIVLGLCENEGVKAPDENWLQQSMVRESNAPGVIIQQLRQGGEQAQINGEQLKHLLDIVDFRKPLSVAMEATNQLISQNKARFVDTNLIRNLEFALKLSYQGISDRGSQSHPLLKNSMLQQRRDFIRKLTKAVLTKQTSLQLKPALIRLAYLSRYLEST